MTYILGLIPEWIDDGVIALACVLIPFALFCFLLTCGDAYRYSRGEDQWVPGLRDRDGRIYYLRRRTRRALDDVQLEGRVKEIFEETFGFDKKG